jgi:uncharacterized protein YndB with AHSA1/START domain
MRKMFVPVLLLSALLFSNGCGKSLTVLNQLAASGSIQEDAPVKTYLQVEIDAPAAKVWTLLTDAGSWPKWQPAIESVTVTGPLASGTRFSWKIGGTNIHSQVQLYEPEHRLGWTGTAMVTKAAHIWELKGESPDRTLVTMKESMDGPWMAKIYPSAKLTEAGRSWLVALKQAAEADKDSN